MSVLRGMSVIGGILMFAGCSGSPDGVRIARERDEAAKLAEEIAALDAQLADTGRAERWREEQMSLARSKAARLTELSAEREGRVARARSGNAVMVDTLRELRRANGMGPPDTVPPMLELLEETSRFGVRNDSGQALRVKMYELLANGRAEVLEHCGLEVMRSSAGRSFEGEVEPGETLWFLRQSRDHCRDERDLPLEFEVRQGYELVWATATLAHSLLGIPPDAIDEVLGAGP